MLKQSVVIGLAAIMFVGVWVLVIFQFNDQREPVALDFTSGVEGNTERAFAFPDSIKEPESNEAVDTEFESLVEPVEVVKKEKISNVVRNGYINLSDYNFGDVSSVDGVPIAAILEKLNLD